MMGRLNRDQGEFFYSFRLNEVVPDDHPVRAIVAVLDLSWVHAELAPFYAKIGRPSILPVLMIRMLVVGYAFAAGLVGGEGFAVDASLISLTPTSSDLSRAPSGRRHVSLRPRAAPTLNAFNRSDYWIDFC
jgi:hypothetical protein